MTQAQRNTYNFLAGMHGNIGRGNAPTLIRRMRSVTPSMVALIRKDPGFAAYLDHMLQKLERGNYSGINQHNFARRAEAASNAVSRALSNAARENETRVQAANAARLQRTRARKANAARPPGTRAAANAARKANAKNARAAARLAESRAASEAAQRNRAAFNAEKDRWEANFAHRRAQGRSVREVIHNMAHRHLHVNIPVNGNITRIHRARIHPDRGTTHSNKALRTVLISHL